MRLFRQLYLTRVFFVSALAIVFLLTMGHFYNSAFIAGKMLLLLFSLVALIDLLILFLPADGIEARRRLPEKFSNGDVNSVSVTVKNLYRFPLKITIIDELPVQLQIRDFQISGQIQSKAEKKFPYTLRPVQRGEYHFGRLNLFISSPVGLISRRFSLDQKTMVAVYPSFNQMRKYELFAVSDRLVEAGIKRIRRVGHTMEFDQIRKYISGDDYRTINWKATARKAKMMVNQYQDERSQQIYSIIDMGRVMKMPFDGMTLLDYAINAGLVLSNVVIHKQDKAGIVTFSDKINSVLPASRQYGQMLKILETLFNQNTMFLESDYGRLYATLVQKIRQRSLIILFTNFETLSALQRQMKYLSRIARRHLLVTVFFKNTELKQLTGIKARTTEELYIKTIAQKFAYEKKQISKELNRHGIHNILTTPQDLTVDTLNKYLELKSRGSI